MICACLWAIEFSQFAESVGSICMLSLHSPKRESDMVLVSGGVDSRFCRHYTSKSIIDILVRAQGGMCVRVSEDMRTEEVFVHIGELRFAKSAKRDRDLSSVIAPQMGHPSFGEVHDFV